ncbi:MAG: MFS transporter, partial [Acidobacteriota bacterium]
LVEAGSLIGLNTVAGIGGSVAYGFISDRLFNARRPPLTLIFALVEIGALLLIFYGPPSTLLMSVGFVLYGFTLSGLIAVLGGLFAIDIAPKRAVGAAMGVVGGFSYLGAGIQELTSGLLVQRGMTMVDGVRHYDFSGATLFWVGASVASMVLATSLWRVRARD